MASTNKTAHYEFPQYIGSDIPNILTDINPAFETIDTALYEQGQQIAEQTTDLSDIQEAVDQATADVAVMQSSIVSMAGIVETTRQLATDNKETIGQGTLDTTAQTLIGASNELNGIIFYIDPDKYVTDGTNVDPNSSYTAPANGVYIWNLTGTETQAGILYSDSDRTKPICNSLKSDNSIIRVIPMKKDQIIYTRNAVNTANTVLGYYEV